LARPSRREEELPSLTRHGRIEEGGEALLSYLARSSKRERRSSLLLLGMAE